MRGWGTVLDRYVGEQVFFLVALPAEEVETWSDGGGAGQSSEAV